MTTYLTYAALLLKPNINPKPNPDPNPYHNHYHNPNPYPDQSSIIPLKFFEFKLIRSTFHVFCKTF